MTSHSYSIPIIVPKNSGPGTGPLKQVHLGDGVKEENWLQTKINDHPSCLPLDEIEPAFGDLIPVCMELPTPHGAIDNLFLTPTGDIVLVEVKLWRNPEMRRKVVAQALDYAAWLFPTDYEGLERALLNKTSIKARGVSSLYELTQHPEQLEEADFIDAVNRNLSKGRALILVVGDGIRTEAQKLVSLLDDYGNLQFTFALVELAVFTKSDWSDEYLICPRVLAKTAMLRRTIIDIKAQPTTSVAKQPATELPKSISSVQFWDAMSELDLSLLEKLPSFLSSVEEFGVTPEGQSINLVYIERNGKVWTNDVHNKLPSTITEPYIRRLASAFGATIMTSPTSGRPNLANATGGGILITEVAEKLDGWKDCIVALIESVRNNPDSL